MGSLSPPQPSNTNPLANYRIYAPFCCRDPWSSTTMPNWIECYNPLDNSWHQVTTIPVPIEKHVLKGFSMASIGDDSLYIIGGRLCRKSLGHDQDDTVEKDVEVVRAVLRYDIRTDEWIECAPLGMPRFDFACTVCEGKIYVAGGISTLACQRGISSAEVYDPALDEWKALPNMSSMKYKCVGVTWQGKVHVVGGFAEREESLTAMPQNTYARSSAEVYDSERNKWDTMVGMWQLDVPPNQIVAINGNLFSSGDCLNVWKGHIEAYDGKLNIWNVVEGSQFQTLFSPRSVSGAKGANWPPSQRLYLSMAPIESHLYFLAGYRMPGEISKAMSVVHVFDTSASEDSWKSLEPMEEEGVKELSSHCCAVRHAT
ncbi:hypothetical protein Tsubulata_030629 [Turnera subulata]|uniref:F-box domain-containing protein n=1 Tax=Turnera subulata TaxID=218843 RepID=A0A9Q0G2Z6_9ROSI|nr:hypothetical protein Tsubulata_030629 [Turnera subulata]